MAARAAGCGPHAEWAWRRTKPQVACSVFTALNTFLNQPTRDGVNRKICRLGRAS